MECVFSWKLEVGNNNIGLNMWKILYGFCIVQIWLNFFSENKYKVGYMIS